MKRYRKFFIGSYIFTVFFPVVSGAQGRVLDAVNNFGLLIRLLPRVLFGLAMVFFFWQTAQFILNAGDEKYREEGKKRLVFGVIVLFVFISIYGILRAIASLLGTPMP